MKEAMTSISHHSAQASPLRDAAGKGKAESRGEDAGAAGAFSLLLALQSGGLPTEAGAADEHADKPDGRSLPAGAETDGNALPPAGAELPGLAAVLQSLLPEQPVGRAGTEEGRRVAGLGNADAAQRPAPAALPSAEPAIMPAGAADPEDKFNVQRLLGAGVVDPAAGSASQPEPAMAAGTVSASYAAPAGATLPGQAAETAIPVRVGAPGWDQALEQKVTWMVNRQEQQASLQLNPPHLGPLEVHLQMKDNQALALFVSPHAAVREAIEAAMPRLRDSFQEQGLVLAGSWLAANADGQSASQQRMPGEWSNGAGRPAPAGVTPLLPAAEQPLQGPVGARHGMVNLFV